MSGDSSGFHVEEKILGVVNSENIKEILFNRWNE